MFFCELESLDRKKRFPSFLYRELMCDMKSNEFPSLSAEASLFWQLSTLVDDNIASFNVSAGENELPRN